MIGAPDGVQPRAVGWPVKQDQTARRRAHDRFDLVVFPGGSVILGHVDGIATMGGLCSNFGCAKFLHMAYFSQ